MAFEGAAAVGEEVLASGAAEAGAAGAAEAGGAAAAEAGGAAAAETGGAVAAEGAAGGAAGGTGLTAGAAGETGITAGTASTAIGGGELGTGIVPSAGTAGSFGGMYGAGTSAVASGLSLADAANSIKAASTILAPIASIAASTAGMDASKRAGRLSGQPVVAPPVTMPTVGSADTLNAVRANMQEQMARRGRAATILTDSSSDKLGG